MHLLLTFGAYLDTHGLTGFLALLSLAGVFGACATLATGQPELGSAVGSCSRCESSPVPRDWFLIDSVDPARGARPNGQVTVQWNGLSPQDNRGRYCGIKSIKISGTALFDGTGANPAVTAYMTRSLYQQINLSDAGGHKYIASMDGRTCIDVPWLMGYRLPFPLDGAIPAAAPAGVVRARIDLEIPLVGRFDGASPTEGIISLAALQQTDGSQGMQFRLGTAIFGNPAAPAGLTLTSFEKDDGSAGLDVWVEYVYTDLPIIDAPWSWREYTIAESNNNLKNVNAKTVLAAARYFPEDAAGNLGQQLVANIDNMTFQVAGATFAEQRRIDMIRRQDFLAQTAANSAAGLGLPQLAQPNEPGVTQGMILVAPYRPRETAPAGPVIFKLATNPNPFVRWVHVTVDCDDEERASKILAAIKCGPATCYQSTNPIINGVPALGVSDATAPKMVIPVPQNR